jgi:CcmD family protein
MFRIQIKSAIITILFLTWVIYISNDLAVIYADDQLKENSDTNEESYLAYLFGVFFLIWLAFFGYIFFLSKRIKEMKTEVEYLKKLIIEK